MAQPQVEELPLCEGWWARGKGGRQVQWFYVTAFDDGTPLSVWINEINDFVPVEKFTTPLTRWWGPITVPFDDNA